MNRIGKYTNENSIMNKYLSDTHTAIWFLNADATIPEKAK
jgi:hypothetical protein